MYIKNAKAKATNRNAKALKIVIMLKNDNNCGKTMNENSGTFSD